MSFICVFTFCLPQELLSAPSSIPATPFGLLFLLWEWKEDFLFLLFRPVNLFFFFPRTWSAHPLASSPCTPPSVRPASRYDAVSSLLDQEWPGFSFSPQIFTLSWRHFFCFLSHSSARRWSYLAPYGPRFRTCFMSMVAATWNLLPPRLP